VGLSRKLLGAGERVVVSRRSHAKLLFWPAVGLIAIGLGVGAGSALVPRDYRPAGQLAVAGLGLLLALWWSVLPFLRWRTTTYTVTTQRLITRRGILTTLGQDLPLLRVIDVSSERSLSDRLLGCGTLVVQTAAEAGPIVLRDVPDVELVHQILTELTLGPPVEDQTRTHALPRQVGR